MSSITLNLVGRRTIELQLKTLVVETGDACTEITLNLPGAAHNFVKEEGCAISTQVLQDGNPVAAVFDGEGNIEVPSCPPPDPCAPVTYSITRDGAPFASGSEPSGGNIAVEVPSDCPAPEPCPDIVVEIYLDNILIATANDVPCVGDTTLNINLNP